MVGNGSPSVTGIDGSAVQCCQALLPDLPLPAPCPEGLQLTVVLDIDEAIVHHSGKQILVRPYLQELLLALNDSLFEVVVWTSLSKDIASIVLAQMDPRGVVQQCIYRHSAWQQGGTTARADTEKDLLRVGRPLSSLIVVTGIHWPTVSATVPICCEGVSGVCDDYMDQSVGSVLRGIRAAVRRSTVQDDVDGGAVPMRAVSDVTSSRGSDAVDGRRSCSVSSASRSDSDGEGGGEGEGEGGDGGGDGGGGEQIEGGAAARRADGVVDAGVEGGRAAGGEADGGVGEPVGGGCIVGGVRSWSDLSADHGPPVVSAGAPVHDLNRSAAAGGGPADATGGPPVGEAAGDAVILSLMHAAFGGSETPPATAVESDYAALSYGGGEVGGDFDPLGASMQSHAVGKESSRALQTAPPIVVSLPLDFDRDGCIYRSQGSASVLTPSKSRVATSDGDDRAEAADDALLVVACWFVRLRHAMPTLLERASVAAAKEHQAASLLGIRRAVSVGEMTAAWSEALSVARTDLSQSPLLRTTAAQQRAQADLLLQTLGGLHASPRGAVSPPASPGAHTNRDAFAVTQRAARGAAAVASPLGGEDGMGSVLPPTTLLSRSDTGRTDDGETDSAATPIAISRRVVGDSGSLLDVKQSADGREAGAASATPPAADGAGTAATSAGGQSSLIHTASPAARVDGTASVVPPPAHSATSASHSASGALSVPSLPVAAPTFSTRLLNTATARLPSWARSPLAAPSDASRGPPSYLATLSSLSRHPHASWSASSSVALRSPRAPLLSALVCAARAAQPSDPLAVSGNSCTRALSTATAPAAQDESTLRSSATHRSGTWLSRLDTRALDLSGITLGPATAQQPQLPVDAAVLGGACVRAFLAELGPASELSVTWGEGPFADATELLRRDSTGCVRRRTPLYAQHVRVLVLPTGAENLSDMRDLLRDEDAHAVVGRLLSECM